MTLTPAALTLSGMRTHPPLHCFGGIRRRTVEADLRMRRQLMHEIDEPLEHQEVRRRAQAGAEHHAVKCLLHELRAYERLGSRANVYEAAFDDVTQCPHTIELR